MQEWNALPVLTLDRLELRFAPRPWDFAEARRKEIAAHFAELVRRMPALYDGRVLLMHDHAIGGGVLRGDFLETDFASMLAWREWGFPDPGVKNCFALGALRGSDGAFVLGVMGAHTANAGRIYFPGGTPDPSDVIGTRVDLEASVRREIQEETGLSDAELQMRPDWHVVLAGPRLALIKVLQARETAQALRARIRDQLAAERQPELADVHVVRSPADLHPMMPPFVPAFLHHFWADERRSDDG